MVCEGSWVRVQVMMCAFSPPVTFGGSVWVIAWAASSKRAVSLVSGMNSSRFGDNSVLAGVNCHKPT